MKLVFYLVGLSTIWTNQIKSQNFDFGISFNPGLSKFSTYGEKNIYGKPYVETNWTASGNGGFYMDMPLSRMSIVGVELLLVLIENKDLSYFDSKFDNPNIPGGFDVVTTKRTIHTHLTYAALPIHYKLRLNMFFVKVGIQTLLLSQSSCDISDTFTLFGETKTNRNHHDISNAKKIDYGPNIGFEIQISQRIILGLEYYLGLKNTNVEFVNRSNRQATLGLQYSLTQKKKISEQ